MDSRLIMLASSLALLSFSLAHSETSICIMANARMCSECIQVDESCAWCSDELFAPAAESKSVRCDDVKSLVAKGCKAVNMENPRGSIAINVNKAFSNRNADERITQIRPQQLSLTLRSGEPQTFDLKFKRAENYPLEVYYLMEQSFTQVEDLESAKKLGANIISQMRSITSDYRIGLGSFVGKTAAPDSSTASSSSQNRANYKNILQLTDNANEFEQLLSQQQISEKWDSPEGGSDAIMQVAVCEEQVGWRNAIRLLVIATDAGLDFAGDGKLPNDGNCHLDNNMYTMSHAYDHPSIAQLVQKLREHNIQTVFAVTEELRPVYKELTNQIPKSSVGMLSNSSNVFKLIIDAYNSLSSEVILENSPLPKGVSITYKSICKDGVEGAGENDRKCSDISVGDEVAFKISMESRGCPSHSKQESIKIKPLGFTEEVEVALNFICDCECSARREPNSNKCSKGHGTFECGACNCDHRRLGHHCECNMDDIWDYDIDAACRKDKGTDVCSNNGDCVCGTCECKKRENPAEIYSGKYCECDNFNCDRSNNKLCGGHGRCECRMCICDANYTGSACDCSLDTSTCLANNGQICNGRGTCECGVCKCTDHKYQGPTCEICPTCPGLCVVFKECVQCRAFQTGAKKDTCERDCSYFELTMVKNVMMLPQPTDDSFSLRHCKERDQDNWFYYTIDTKKNVKEIHVAKMQEYASGGFVPAGLEAGFTRNVKEGIPSASSLASIMMLGMTKWLNLLCFFTASLIHATLFT